jgi:hypothetical protein
MTIFLNDTFTDTAGTLLTAHTGEVGATWAVHPASPSASYVFDGDVNMVRCTSGGRVVASGLSGTESYDVTLELYRQGGGAQTDLGVVFDIHATAMTCYMARYSQSSAGGPGRWQLYKFVAGAATLMSEWEETVALATARTILVERRPGSQKMYVNGVLRATATDTAVPFTGRVGLTAFYTTDNQMHATSITATDYPANAAPIINVGSAATITAGDTFTRAVTFTDADSVSTSWTATADYGEGAGPTAASVDGVAKTIALSNLYETAGVYTITVEVEDDGGLTDSDTIALTVDEAPVLPSFGRFIVAAPDATPTDPGAPSITLTGAMSDVLSADEQSALDVLTSNPGYDHEVRGGSAGLVFGKTRVAHINDRAGVDPTGVSDMGATITSLLATMDAEGVNTVVFDGTYLIGSTVTVPGGMTLTGPGEGDGNSGAIFECGGASVTMFAFPGDHTTIQNCEIDMNNLAGAIGLAPARHYQRVLNVTWRRVASGTAAIKGGGILYFTVRGCKVYNVNGRFIDLLDAYNPVGYYGVNVGWIDHNYIGATEGAIRIEGTFTIHHNSFERAATNPQIEVAGTHNSYGSISDNYFEHSGGTGISILVSVNGSALQIHGNGFYGPTGGVAGSAAVKVTGGSVSGMSIIGNTVQGYEWGFDLDSVSSASDGTLVVLGNRFGINSLGNITGGGGGGSTERPALIQDPDIGNRFWGGVEVNGELDHNGAEVGFYGVTPVTRRTLPAAATDAATTQALANALRQALIDLGLGV